MLRVVTCAAVSCFDVVAVDVPAPGVGEVHGGAVGEVVVSDSDAFAVGDIVESFSTGKMLVRLG